VAAPAFRLYLNTVEGSSVSQRLLLRRADGQPLEARLVKASLEQGLRFELAQPQDGDEAVGRITPQPGDLWLVATVDAPAAVVEHNGTIVLATNDPRAPSLEVPLMVRVQRAIDLRPSLVRLWPAEGGPGGASALVRVAHAGRGTFEITGLEVADPKLVSATLESTGNQAIHSLRVSLAEGVTAADVGRRTTVRIATSDPLRPLVELPVELVAQHLAARRPVQPPTTATVAGDETKGGG
jgi:hypothetical protein